MANLDNGLYVGCALAYAPDAFKESIKKIKDDLRQRGYRILDFLDADPANPEQVYRWDIEECVSKCSAMLAIADYPSLGLGWEMATAAHLGIPTLAVAQKDRLVTKFVLGAAEAVPSFCFARYENLRDIAEQMDKFLDKHFADQPTGANSA